MLFHGIYLHLFVSVVSAKKELFGKNLIANFILHNVQYCALHIEMETIDLIGLDTMNEITKTYPYPLSFSVGTQKEIPGSQFYHFTSYCRIRVVIGSFNFTILSLRWVSCTTICFVKCNICRS